MTFKQRQRHAKTIRGFRKIHKYSGITLAICFLCIAITGIALGLKKNSADLILPQTRTGSSATLSSWKPLNELENIAVAEITPLMKNGVRPEIDRIDIRPEKGIAKVIFTHNLLEVQLDGATGAVLHRGKRYSDLLEDLHDGSYIDQLFGWKNGIFKIIYTLTCGLALVTFCITGFWLWYGPKYMKRLR